MIKDSDTANIVGPGVLGWDIGGANIKAAYLGPDGQRIIQRPFAIWEAPGALPGVLAEIAGQLGPAICAGVTITAELSDAFRSKREGIAFVLDALQAALPEGVKLSVFGSDGQFHEPQTAREFPLLVAAANWMATATLLARHEANCVLVDVGSTTTDVIPIVDGLVVARGRDDPSRLIHGELLYTGLLRTSVCAIVQRVPLWGYWCPVAAEYFATTQDVYLLLGDLQQEDCAGPTADGRPATAPFAAERLARVVCADAEMLSSDEILAIARYIAGEQTRQIAGAISQVRARSDVHGPLVASGSGAFLVQKAAAQLGSPCRSLPDVLEQRAGGKKQGAKGQRGKVARGTPPMQHRSHSADAASVALRRCSIGRTPHSVAAPAFAIAVLLSEKCDV
jgi:hypothetical protein